jgi:hypothetical protein
MIGAIRLAALAVLLAGLAAGCGGGGGGGSAVAGEPISFAELADAATTSADAATGRFEFSLEMTFPGSEEPFGFSGAGAFDTAADRASLSFDMSAFASMLGGLFAGLAGSDGPDLGDPDAWRIETVQDGLVMYMRFPAVADQLPEGKSWVRMDLRSAGKAQGFDFSQLEQFTSNDPRKILEYLRALSGEIETIGAEELRGVATTHYRANVDLSRYDQLVPAAKREELKTMLGEIVEQSGIGDVPVDVWLDEFGLVRKLAMAFSATQPGTSESASVSMTFELYDYGKEIAIEVPAASDVVDAASLGP